MLGNPSEHLLDVGYRLVADPRLIVNVVISCNGADGLVISALLRPYLYKKRLHARVVLIPAYPKARGGQVGVGVNATDGKHMAPAGCPRQRPERGFFDPKLRLWHAKRAH